MVFGGDDGLKLRRSGSEVRSPAQRSVNVGGRQSCSSLYS